VKKRKTLNTIAVIGMLIGALLFIGTMGAWEWHDITTSQAIVQSLLGLGVAVLGGRVFAATYNPSDYDYEEDDYE